MAIYWKSDFSEEIFLKRFLERLERCFLEGNFLRFLAFPAQQEFQL